MQINHQGSVSQPVVHKCVVGGNDDENEMIHKKNTQTNLRERYKEII